MDSYDMHMNGEERALRNDMRAVAGQQGAISVEELCAAMNAASEQILDSYRTWVADDVVAKPRYGQIPRYDELNNAITRLETFGLAAPSPSPAPGVVTILNAAYAAGFEASGEGWNAEYPFADDNEDFEDDLEWASLRDKRIAPLLASLSQPAKGEREGGGL